MELGGMPFLLLMRQRKTKAVVPPFQEEKVKAGTHLTDIVATNRPELL
jgi:hypothetical protein